jgi:hypothetical protein
MSWPVDLVRRLATPNLFRVWTLTEMEAAIQGATTVLVYRKLNKPALGSIGDSLDDMWGSRP